MESLRRLSALRAWTQKPVLVEYSNNKGSIYLVDQLASLAPKEVAIESENEEEAAEIDEQKVVQFPQRNVG